MNKHLFSAIAASTMICFGAAAQDFVTYNIQDNDMTIYVPGIQDTVRLFVISDTHLFMSDQREDPFRDYSQRMSKAYNRVKHFKTGEPTTPEESLPASLAIAAKFKADAVLHLGDLVSYPSEKGIEWAKAQFDACGIPWYYISGNHDWHYEGMEGTEEQLREEWREKRLSALYQGHEPANYSVMVKGVKVILVDDTINEILPEQVKYLKKELKQGIPSLLMMHIPINTPGRSDTGFTIGNPRWGAAIDRAYRPERRPIWREHHLQADYDFYNTALRYGARKNLLAVVTGHEHFTSCSVQNGIPTLTVDDNASGGYMTITIIPKK